MGKGYYVRRGKSYYKNGEIWLYSRISPGEKLLYSQFSGGKSGKGERLLYNTGIESVIIWIFAHLLKFESNYCMANLARRHLSLLQMK